jgi:molybdopterin converting factor subunit 1
MKLRVLLFAGLAEKAGGSSLEIEIDSDSDGGPVLVGGLRLRLEAQLPGLAESGYRVAIDHQYVDDHHPVSASQEIALIPPVSGG